MPFNRGSGDHRASSTKAKSFLDRDYEDIDVHLTGSTEIRRKDIASLNPKIAPAQGNVFLDGLQDMRSMLGRLGSRYRE